LGVKQETIESVIGSKMQAGHVDQDMYGKFGVFFDQNCTSG